MNYVTVKLTEDQARLVLTAIWAGLAPTDPFTKRLKTKFEKALAKAKS